jgi:hypothetical protein
MNFNNIINKHILYDGDHSYTQNMRPFPYIFVVTTRNALFAIKLL